MQHVRAYALSTRPSHGLNSTFKSPPAKEVLQPTNTHTCSHTHLPLDKLEGRALLKGERLFLCIMDQPHGLWPARALCGPQRDAFERDEKVKTRLWGLLCCLTQIRQQKSEISVAWWEHVCQWSYLCSCLPCSLLLLSALTDDISAALMPWVRPDDAAGFHSMSLQHHGCMCMCVRERQNEMKPNTHLVNVTESECCNRRQAHLLPCPLSVALRSSPAALIHSLSSSSSALPPSVFCSSGCSLYRSFSLSIPPSPLLWLCEWKDGRRMNEGWWIGWVCLAWPLLLQEPLQCCKPLLTHAQSISHAPFLSNLSVFSGILLVKNHLWMSRGEWVNRFIILRAPDDDTHLQREGTEDNEGKIDMLS